jgi:hypothetical protein
LGPHNDLDYVIQNSKRKIHTRHSGSSAENTAAISSRCRVNM